MTSKPYIIIGGGIAGVSCAEEVWTPRRTGCSAILDPMLLSNLQWVYRPSTIGSTILSRMKPVGSYIGDGRVRISTGPQLLAAQLITVNALPFFAAFTY